MRRMYVILLCAFFMGLFLNSCTEPRTKKVAESESIESTDLNEPIAQEILQPEAPSSNIAKTPGKGESEQEALASRNKSAIEKLLKGSGDFVALAKVVRTVWDEEGLSKTQTYDFEYADEEYRTSVRAGDYEKEGYATDAFFNNDRTLSFVRKRAGGGHTETVHFVYDAEGDLVEKRESRDDMPLEKIEYQYDESNLSKRDIKKSQWSDGQWKPMLDSSQTLYVNVNDLPTAFESTDGGRRAVVFEYAMNGALLDSYKDTYTTEDGEASSTFAFVSYKGERPAQMTIRSDSHANEEQRITGQWQKIAYPGGMDLLVGETVEQCIAGRCKKLEQRSFEYERRNAEALMPPPSLMLPFLELGSSLYFIEKPEILLGKEGLGLPTWLIAYDKS